MKLRKASLHDIPRLVEIEATSFSSKHCFTYQASHFRYIIQHANADLLVVGTAKDICGYALMLYRKGSKYGRLYSIAVAAGHRKKGLGRKLFNAAERAAYLRRCHTLHLEVRADNKRNQRIYRRWGCRKTAVYPQHFPDKVDAIRMDKCLEM